MSQFVLGAKPLLLVALIGSLSACTTFRPASGQRGVPEKSSGLAGVWDGSPATEHASRIRSVVGKKGMVVSDDRMASEWGAEILRRGGNAVDAAVATAFMLSVTRPQFGSLGGGGFLVYCPAPKSGRTQACDTIDYREKAPRAATRDLYLRNGKAVPALSQDGALAVGVPGVVAGLTLASERWGKFSRAKVLERPIQLARGGFPLSGYTETVAQIRWDAMNPEAKKIFGCTTGIMSSGGSTSSIPKLDELKPCPVGTILRQPGLANLLEGVRAHGRSAFYEGPFAARLVQGLRDAGGIMTLQDLRDYRAERRAPLVGHYRGLEVVSMAPPSAGGGTLLQMLAYTERADRAGELKEGFGASRTLHAEIHAMRLAFADRAQFYGDPDQVTVPLSGLLEPQYLDKRWSSFRKGRAVEVKSAGKPRTAAEMNENYPARESSETTHFSVIDAEGNAVSVTTTINDNFGAAFVSPGTGVVLNNEMDDFAAQPGVPNMYGLVGTEANSVASGKRPLSSMTPTIVRDDTGLVRLVLGAQGGPRITTAVYQTIVNRARFGMSLPEAVFAPRVHHQWKPAAVIYDRDDISPDTLKRLSAMGYELTPATSLGRLQALERFPETGRVWGASDPRTEGAAVAQ